MEGLLLAMPGFAIEKVLSYAPPIFEVRFVCKNACPHCGSERLRVKDTFMRTIRNVPITSKGSRFQVKCHKYRSQTAGSTSTHAFPA